MLIINTNYLNLKDNYLFSRIAQEKNKIKDKDKLIDLSIGDVTLPLTQSIITGLHIGIDNLSDIKTFTGYPPSSGHDFLKELIIKKDYMQNGIKISNDELFISDSSKSDISSILDIFETKITVAIYDPVYPAYVDSNIIRGNNIVYYSSYEELITKILSEEINIDILYICSPNNPTGEVISKKILKRLIHLAHKFNFIIFFDSAYEAFIRDTNTVHSIYEIKGSKDVAIEFRSFSKTAGYTPLRLAYTIVPKEIVISDLDINMLFSKLKNITYNGPSYLSEYGIYNLYNKNEFDELKDNINYYLENTKLLYNFFHTKGLVTGNINNINSPYIWIKTPNNVKSWDYFYNLLNNYSIVGTPGVGFGQNGEYHFRFTGFSSREKTLEAIERLKDM